jgi:hypothetical protein
MTRTGKIARLPQALRDELNQRLQDGRKGVELVQWLNGLPEVQAILAAQFQGQPISPVNLTEWKQGGYPAWQREQAKREGLALFVEDSRRLLGMGQDDLAGHMARFLSVNMALELQRLDAMPDGPEKSKTWREMLGSLVLLRRGNFQGERLVLEREKIGLRREWHKKEREAEFWQWSQQPENRGKILQSLLTPEQNKEEIERRKAETQRKMKDALGIE